MELETQRKEIAPLRYIDGTRYDDNQHLLLREKEKRFKPSPYTVLMLHPEFIKFRSNFIAFNVQPEAASWQGIIWQIVRVKASAHRSPATSTAKSKSWMPSPNRTSSQRASKAKTELRVSWNARKRPFRRNQFEKVTPKTAHRRKVRSIHHGA